jgi:hypothetical protein
MASPSHHPRFDLTLSGVAGSHPDVLADVGARADAFFGPGRHRIETISVTPRVQRGLDGEVVRLDYEYDAYVTDGTVEALLPLVSVRDHVCDFHPTIFTDTSSCTICGDVERRIS